MQPYQMAICNIDISCHLWMDFDHRLEVQMCYFINVIDRPQASISKDIILTDKILKGHIDV